MEDGDQKFQVEGAVVALGGTPTRGAAFPDGGAETPKAAAAPSQRGMGRKLVVLLHLDSLG